MRSRSQATARSAQRCSPMRLPLTHPACRCSTCIPLEGTSRREQTLVVGSSKAHRSDAGAHMYLMMMHDRPTSWPAPRAMISSSLRVAMLRGACSALQDLAANRGGALPPAPRRPAPRYCGSRQRRDMAWRHASGKRRRRGGPVEGEGVCKTAVMVRSRSEPSKRYEVCGQAGGKLSEAQRTDAQYCFEVLVYCIANPASPHGRAPLIMSQRPVFWQSCRNRTLRQSLPTLH